MSTTYDLPEEYRERLRAGGRKSVEVKMARCRDRANAAFDDLSPELRERIARSIYEHELDVMRRWGKPRRKNVKTAV